MKQVQKEKAAAVEQEQFDLAAELFHKENDLKEKMQDLKLHWVDLASANQPQVTREDIAEVLAMWTGVPVTRIAGEESERLLKMEEELHKRIIGQEEAITNVAKAVRRARAGLKDPKRR